MTDNTWNWVDPVQRAREQQALLMAPQPSWPVAPLQPIQSPLANLPMAEAQVFSNPGIVPQRRRVAESMLMGAVIGVLFGNWLHRRCERKDVAKPLAVGSSTLAR